MVWRWLECAIIWHVCLGGTLYMALGDEAEHHVGHGSSSSTVHFPRGGNEYRGPKPKKILPLYAIKRGDEGISHQLKANGTAVIPGDSSIAKAHAGNWENVSKGIVHHVYGGRGPNGSLGVDPALAERHSNRKRNRDKGEETDRKEGSMESYSGTRQAAVYPRPPPNACLSLTNLRHTTHVIDAYVGTPAQQFLPMLDTGSTNTWVVHQDCDLQGCTTSLKFNPSMSSTFHTPEESQDYIRVKFVSGDVIGKLGVDNFTIGGATVKGQTFAMLMGIPDKATQDILQSTHFSGMIGLAFPNLMVANTEPLYQSYLKALNAPPIFSFYYSNYGHNSAVMFGGADSHFHKSKIKMMPVVGDSYWQVRLKQVWIGDHKVCCDGPAYAIFDTGTTFNSMPYDAFVQLLDIYPFSKCDEGTVAERISTLPTIKYIFDGGVEAKLQPNHYTFISNGFCKPAYMQINVHVSDGPAYILGSMGFMPHYYTVYQGGEQPMVGIAPADHERAAAFMAKEKLLRQ